MVAGALRLAERSACSAPRWVFGRQDVGFWAERAPHPPVDVTLRYGATTQGSALSDAREQPHTVIFATANTTQWLLSVRI